MDFVDIDGDGDPDAVVSNTSTVVQPAEPAHRQPGRVCRAARQASSSTRPHALGQPGREQRDDQLLVHRAVPGAGLAAGSSTSRATRVLGDLDADGDMDLVHSTYGGVFNGGTPAPDLPERWARLLRGVQPLGIPAHQPARSPTAFPPCGPPACNSTGPRNTTVSTPTSQTTASPSTSATWTATSTSICSSARGTSSRASSATSSAAAHSCPSWTSPTQPSRSWPAERWPLRAGARRPRQRRRPRPLRRQLGRELQQDTSLMLNDGDSGIRSVHPIVSGSTSDDEEADCFDYDADGDLDVYVANFSGQDKLYANGGAPGYALTQVTGAPTRRGQQDRQGRRFRRRRARRRPGRDGRQRQRPGRRAAGQRDRDTDTHAPRVVVEQVANTDWRRPAAVVVRANVYDNASWD